MSLKSDNGCLPMSVAFVKVCATLGITQTFASDNNPKGNADAERLMRTLKAELLWLRERTSALDLERGTDGVGRLVQHEVFTIGAQALRSWPLDKWGALNQVGPDD